MAILYVTEFAKLGQQLSLFAMVQAAQQPPVAEQAITFSTVAASVPFNPATRFVRLQTDGICSISIGQNPTATTGMARMTAGQTEYYGVRPGDKISVIANT